MTGIDWKKEQKSLKNPEDFERKNWWNPSAGQHKVKFLSEGEPYQVQFEKEIKDKVAFNIEVLSTKYSWGITKGLTERSLWGQIVLFANFYGNLVDREITLLVKGKGKDKDYTILEALPTKGVGVKE